MWVKEGILVTEDTEESGNPQLRKPGVSGGSVVFLVYAKVEI